MIKYLFIVFTLIFSTGCTVINPGEVGVVFNKYTSNLWSENPGVVFWLPGRSVEAYPIALRTYSMVRRGDEGSAKNDDSIDLPSKEGQHITQDISITYNTSPDKAVDVFKSFKGDDISDIEKSFIRRTTITVAQNVAGQMSLVELISTKRDELQSNIQLKLSVELNKMGFIVDKVNLGAAHLPDSVEKQMQAKMAAQQDAQRAEYELVKQTTLAKSHIVEAEGIAKANSILQSSLTSAVLESKRIDKWNGVLPTVTTSGGLMMNLGSKQSQ